MRREEKIWDVARMIASDRSLLADQRPSVRQTAYTATWWFRRLPDWLVIGGQRCGTTALDGYLRFHPGIGSARIDEVHYFTYNFHRGTSWYRGYFPTDAHRAWVRHRYGLPTIAGETTPYYLFHPRAPQRVRDVLPEVKMLIILRDPVERAYSHYHHEVMLGFETLSFDEAIAAESDRLRGEEERILSDPRYYSFAHQHYSYVARGMYIDQLERWSALFPKERFLTVRTEDLVERPREVMSGIFTFLGLPPDHLPKTVVASGGDRAGTTPDPRGWAGSSRPPMNPETREMLRARFADANQRLGAFLGRDMEW